MTPRLTRLVADLDAEIEDTERKLRALKEARRALMGAGGEAASSSAVNGLASSAPQLSIKPFDTVELVRSAPGASKAGLLLAALKETPGATIAALAQRVYGNAERQSQHRVRSMISFLAKQQKIRQIERGRWEVAPANG